jgi:2-aminoadipate transaminase
MSRQPSDHRAALALSAKAKRTTEQPISYLIAASLANPKLINLAAGLVDSQTLPVQETADLVGELLSSDAGGQAVLQYGTTPGLLPLRQAVLEHIEALEGKPASAMSLRPQDIVITNGSQQALYLIGDVLLDPGDIVIAANPSYFVYTGTLASLGADVRTVPMTAHGMDVEAVGALLGQLERTGELRRVKLIYCTSYYQNPTGLTLSASARPRLLELVRRFSRHHRILILEDAAYRELGYDGERLPSIKSHDAENRYTILAHTFSKPFAPGIKTGYTAMPADLVDAVVQQKGNHDFGSSNLCQNIALEALRSGAYQRHGERLRASYRGKRDLMLAALDRFMPGDAPGLSWTRPHGGLYVWLTLPQWLDTSRSGAMFQSCMDRGVLYVPGDYCFQVDPATGLVPRNHLRLSFGQVAPEQIEPGIWLLAQVMRDELSAERRNRAEAHPTGGGLRITSEPLR